MANRKPHNFDVKANDSLLNWSGFSRNDLSTQWFSEWNPEIEEALYSLPESKDYSHDLYRLILQNPIPVQKKIAVIYEKGEPIAIAGFRRQHRHWVTLTHFLLPGFIFPTRDQCLTRSINQIHLDMFIAWWRFSEPPEGIKNIHFMEKVATHRWSTKKDIEEYWKSSGQYKTVRLRRNRCKNFNLEINQPGAAEWTIKNWSARWELADAQMENSYRALIAQYLEPQGKHYTFTLSDQGNFIAGATVIVHQNDLVAGVSYRDPEYNWYGVGDRLIDAVFCWATDSPYNNLDLGGGHEYKHHWAPEEGERWSFNICPWYAFRMKQALHWIKARKKGEPQAQTT